MGIIQDNLCHPYILSTTLLSNQERYFLHSYCMYLQRFSPCINIFVGGIFLYNIQLDMSYVKAYLCSVEVITCFDDVIV